MPRDSKEWKAVSEDLDSMWKRETVVVKAPTVRPWEVAARRQASGLATYAAAFALEGVIKAIVERDPEALVEHGRQMTQPAFWGAALLFGVASQATETAVTYGASRVPAAVAQAVPKAVVGVGKLAQGGLYMAVGMAAVQYALTGQVSLKDVAISTASYMIAGVAVNLLVDAAMFLVLGSTPVGWVYIVAKLALTLYFGEKLDAWIRSWWDGASERAAVWFDGVKQKVDALSRRLDKSEGADPDLDKVLYDPLPR